MRVESGGKREMQGHDLPQTTSGDVHFGTNKSQTKFVYSPFINTLLAINMVTGKIRFCVCVNIVLEPATPELLKFNG
jgi:hypothetical protein